MTGAAMATLGLSQRIGGRAGAAVLATSIAVLAATSVLAQPAHTAPPASTTMRPVPVENGIAWHDLTPPQKDFLRPLERDWTVLDPMQKRKWLELTSRVPKMSADERSRIQTRMTDWAKLTPEQRSQARLRYQEARKTAPRDRQARWDAYQMLPTERKQQLAERASLGASSSAAARRTAVRPARDLPQAKSNIVASPEPAALPRPVAPTLVQARPGATTTSIARVPSPPPHQQPGLPKIAATPEFVNRSTLLPRLGPQAAASRAASMPGTPAPP